MTDDTISSNQWQIVDLEDYTWMPDDRVPCVEMQVASVRGVSMVVCKDYAGVWMSAVDGNVILEFETIELAKQNAHERMKHFVIAKVNEARDIQKRFCVPVLTK